jgi:hypothetical protein
VREERSVIWDFGGQRCGGGMKGTPVLKFGTGKSIGILSPFFPTTTRITTPQPSLVCLR